MRLVRWLLDHRGSPRALHLAGTTRLEKKTPGSAIDEGSLRGFMIESITLQEGSTMKTSMIFSVVNLKELETFA